MHICQEAQQRRGKIPEPQSSAACTHGKKEQASARKHTEKPVQRRSLAAKLRLHAQPKRRDHREPDLAGSS